MAIKVKSLSEDSKAEVLATLFTAANSFQGEEAAANFIKQFLTESEQITIGRRLQIAALLRSGMSQTEIRHKLGVSPSTFSRTRKWLEQEVPSYGEALKIKKQEEELKLQHQQASQERQRSSDPFTFAAIKRKYPVESLWFTLASKLRGK